MRLLGLVTPVIAKAIDSLKTPEELARERAAREKAEKERAAAMKEKREQLEATINAVDCDLVLVATPIDLTRLLTIEKPHMRIRYFMPPGDGTITEAVKRTLDR